MWCQQKQSRHIKQMDDWMDYQRTKCSPTLDRDFPAFLVEFTMLSFPSYLYIPQ